MDNWKVPGRTDGRTHRKIMLLSHKLTMRESDVARRRDERTTDGITHRKIMLLSHTLTMRGSDVVLVV